MYQIYKQFKNQQHTFTNIKIIVMIQKIWHSRLT
jgi:hypothetical protein